MTRREALAAERAAAARQSISEAPKAATPTAAEAPLPRRTGRRAAPESAAQPHMRATFQPMQQAIKPAPARPEATPIHPEPTAARARKIPQFSPRAFMPRTKPPQPINSAPGAAPRRARRWGASVGSMLAMGFVAAIFVAVSTPAEALMSSSDVQAKQIAAASEAAVKDGQVILANQVQGGSVGTELYDATSKSAYAVESGISRVENSFVNNPNGTVQWPFAVGVPIGDQYGSTWGRDSAHRGLDFNPGSGAPVQAIADGVVTFAEDGEDSLGVHLMITHVINGQTVTSVYAHLIHGSMRFNVGDQVKVGQVIGNVGNTGYSTGPHLHFEIRIGGITGEGVDPLTWLRSNTN